MNSSEFDKILDRRIELICDVLNSKKKEYAPEDGDRLHNFNVAALMQGISREQALFGMLAKHLVSIIDIIRNMPLSKPTEAIVEEKIGDSINYLILLEAMIKEDIR